MGVDLKTSRVMLLLSLLGALGHASGAAIEPCCLSKTVGGVDYVLWDENTGMTSGYGCLQDCIYVRLDDPNKQYCFASGTLPVECDESPSPSSMPPSPSMYPPSPSEYPPSPSEFPPSPSEFPPFPSAMPPAPSSSMPPAPTQAPSPFPAATTTGPDDAVVTRVKGYIDAGTCSAVTFGDYSSTECADGATSYYKEFTYNNKRVIISNNIPGHAAEHDMLTPNPNLRCPGWQYISMPIDPVKGTSFTDTSLGTIGLAVTGGAFFNDLSNPDGSLALTNEGPSLDSCLG